MNNGYRSQFSLRYGKSRIPTVEVTVATITRLDPFEVHHEVVKKFRGLSKTQAFNRALEWTRKHGGTR